MSKLNIKQLGSTGASTNASLVYNGTSLVFSNNHNGALLLPSGTTGQQPTPANGMIRYNSTTNKFEAYENGAWTNIINASAGFTKYTFTFTWNATTNIASASNLPSGWSTTGTYPSATPQIVTGLSSVPALIKYESTNGATLRNIWPSTANGYITYTSGSPGTLQFNGMNNTAAFGVSSGGNTVVSLWF